MGDITQEELDRLSPEEREALAGDDDERANLQGVVDDIDDDDVGSSTDGKEGKDGDGNGDGQGDGDGDGDDAAGKNAGAGSGTVDDSDDDDTDRPFTPVYHAAATEETDAKLAELDTQRAAIMQAFRDGDKSIDEMEAELKDLDAQRSTLQEQKVKAAVFNDMAQQQANQQWQWEINRFLKTVKRSEGIDYRDEKNKHLNNSLDGMVKMLAADPENADKDGEWFLEEAHRLTKARFNLGSANSGSGKPGGDGKPSTPAPRRPDLKSVPPTLSQVPNAGADDKDTGDDEFAYLDKLSGMELEAELARMSPAKQDRYLRSA